MKFQKEDAPSADVTPASAASTWPGARLQGRIDSAIAFAHETTTQLRCMRPHRLVVRTSRRGRDNPGSTPGVDVTRSYMFGLQCWSPVWRNSRRAPHLREAGATIACCTDIARRFNHPPRTCRGDVFDRQLPTRPERKDDASWFTYWSHWSAAIWNVVLLCAGTFVAYDGTVLTNSTLMGISQRPEQAVAPNPRRTYCERVRPTVMCAGGCSRHLVWIAHRACGRLVG